MQDAWVRGIRPEAYKLAIRLVGTKERRSMTPAQREALEKSRLASPLIPIRTVQDGSLPAQNASGGADTPRNTMSHVGDLRGKN